MLSNSLCLFAHVHIDVLLMMYYTHTAPPYPRMPSRVMMKLSDFHGDVANEADIQCLGNQRPLAPAAVILKERNHSMKHIRRPEQTLGNAQRLTPAREENSTCTRGRDGCHSGSIGEAKDLLILDGSRVENIMDVSRPSNPD